MREAFTYELSREETWAIVKINDEAHMTDHGHNFTATDWANACGGLHFIEEEDGEIVSHAAVVPRVLETGARAFRTGYVEAVATEPSHWGRGFGSTVMAAATEHVREVYELGALSAGANAFYERFGWQTWEGPTFVPTDTGSERTAEEDGGIMILRTPLTPSDLEVNAPISCEWREGDVW